MLSISRRRDMKTLDQIINKTARRAKIKKRARKLIRRERRRQRWIDPDDAPEWTKEQFERADLYHGDRLVRRGRPPVPRH